MYYVLTGGYGRSIMPCGGPTPFEYAGRKGHIQLFGQVLPMRAVLMRVGFRGDGRSPLPGGAAIVSLPNRVLSVNPQGWSPYRPSEAVYKRGFIVHISTPKMIPVIDHPSTAEAVGKLRDELGGEPVGITLMQNLIQVDKCSPSAEHRDQLRFVHAVIRFLDTLPVVRTGIEGRIDEGPGPDLTVNLARCDVCRQPLGWPIIVCNGCVTPHHRDCWEYTGGCATYACLRRIGTVMRSREELDLFMEAARSLRGAVPAAATC